MMSKKFGHMIVMTGLIVCQQLFAYEKDFSTAEYSANVTGLGSVPTGWELKNKGASYVIMTSEQPQPKSGSEETGMGVNFYNATLSNLLKGTEKVDIDVVCDTLLATLRIWVQKESDVKDLNDAYQIVVSTNNWTTYEKVGAPIYNAEAGRTSKGWVTYSRRLTMPGLAAASRDIYIGILFTTSSVKSHGYGYIRSISLNSAATAAPSDVCLKNNGEEITGLVPGDNNLSISAIVSPDPNDDRIQLEGVYGVISRNGILSTNKLVRVGNTQEYTNLVISSVLDAGETLEVSAYSRYTATPPLPPAGSVNSIDGYAYEDSQSGTSYMVGKLGSVWINELSADCLEVCGTTNRVLLPGWKLMVTDENGTEICKADLGAVFDLTTNMINKVVGLDTRNLIWSGDLPTDDKTYSVSLVNSHGITEHTVKMSFANGEISGLTGYAPWHGSYGYDWAGTATDGTFTWSVEAESSFGSVNVGQGFSVSASCTLTVRTVDQNGAGISYATVIASIPSMNNATFKEVSSDGYATLTIVGETPFPENIEAGVSGSAFGWACEMNEAVLSDGCTLTNTLPFFPSVAEDEFTDLGYWNNVGTLQWALLSTTREQKKVTVLGVNTYSVTTGSGRLRSKNYLSAHGHSLVSVAFDFCNFVDSGVKYGDDEFTVSVSTNSTFTGTIVSSPALSTKRAKYDDGEWYRYQSVFQMPHGFESAPEIWIELECVSHYKTHAYTYVDNLRIAFQDIAMPTNLVRSVEDVASGDEVGFNLDVVPQTGDFVSNVTATLNFTLNGATTNVPFAFAGATSTNLDGDATAEIKAADLKAVMGAMTGIAGGRPFLTGDTVSYYAMVNYFADNADTDESKQYENRYFPDNHQTVTVGDVEHWVVEGTGTDPYTYVATNFTVTGDALTVVTNGLTTTADGVSMFVHGYNEDGVSNLTVTISNRTTAAVTTYRPFASTNAPVRVSGWFNLSAGLDASTDYGVVVTAVDASGNAIVASKEVIFTTKPMIPTPVITGVSSTTAKLTVSGAAAGYVVEPADWGVGTKDGDVWHWTRDDGTPNREFTATVTATNKLGEASEVVTTNGYTLAAVATKAPVVEKDASKTKVVVRAADDETPNGNPSRTEYAIAISTNGMAAAIATTNGVEVWKTLDEWKGAANAVTFSEQLDLLATNSFFFVTRNEMGEWNWTQSSGPETNCTFDMTARVVGHGQMLAPDFGLVAITNAFFDPAQQDSVATLQYRIGEGEWQDLTNGLEVAFDELAVTNVLVWNAHEAVGDGSFAYSLRAKVANRGIARASEWSEVVSGTLDFVKPTVALSSTTPETFGPSASPMKVSVSFGKEVSGFSSAAISVANGTIGNFSGSGSSYAFEVTPTAEGTVSVQVPADKANDKFGNKNAASETLARTYHATPPEWDDPAFAGYPAEGVVTNGAAFAFKVSASDTVTPVTYEWLTNGTVVAGQTTDTYEAVGREGTNTVTVIATDGVGNRSVATNRTWVVDTVRPTLPEAVVCEPAGNSTVKSTEYAFTVESKDATALTYHWLLNGAAVDSAAATIAGTAREEGNEVSVFATDEAGNVSPTNAWSWTVDTLAPSNFAFTAESAPAANRVVSSKSFSFTVSALDQTAVRYFWKMNQGEWAEGTADCAGDAAPEGTNTVSVYVQDAAGNACDAISRTWVVDTEAPQNLTVAGIPANGALTNSTAVALAASAEDATKIAYHWTYNGTPVDGKDALLSTNSLEGAAVANTAEVYATDEAGNVSATNYWKWTVDTVAPAVTNLTSATPDPFGQGTEFLTVKVMFSEPVVGFTKDSVSVDNGATVDSVTAEDAATYAVSVKPGDEGLISIWIPAGAARDEAGNGNAASATLKRTYDTQPPADFNLAGTPGDGDRTTSTDFRFTASAADTTKLTYHWVTNGVEVTDNVTSNFEGVVSEGTNTFSVSVEDELGNPCDPIVRTWIVDFTPPVWGTPAITGHPANGAVTNQTGIALTAHVTDRWTRLAYHWTLNGEILETTGPELAAQSEAGGRVENSASVYATDEAGNATATNRWSWTVDTVAPQVTNLWTATPGHFNHKSAPMTVTAEFSEPVADFTADCITVGAGTVVDDEVLPVDGKANAYVFKVMPADVDYTNVTVRIAAGAVRDAAGNPNEASAVLSRVYDNRNPIVTLESATPDAFRTGDLVVTATFTRGKNSEPATITNFTAAAVAVENGTVTAVSPTDYATNVYTITIAPQEGKVTVAIPESAVLDDLGNENVASDPLSRTYDVTPPTAPALSGIPVSTDPARLVVTNGVFFELTAESQDFTAIRYHWTTNGVPVSGIAEPVFSGTVPEGTNTLVVYATDAAGNAGGAVTNRWVVDLTAPTVPEIAGSPADKAITAVREYGYAATAGDATAVTFFWRFDAGEERELAAGDTLSGDGLADGPHTVAVYARDEAGNKSAVTNRTWIVDTAKPTDLNVTGLPISDDPETVNVTNGVGFAFTATAADANPCTFHWATNGVAVTDCTASNFVGRVGEGTNTVTVYAKDAAGNACEAISRTWVVDVTVPTVTVTTDVATDHTVNIAESPFTVTVAFSETVRDFTAQSVTVANGTVAEVRAAETENAYLVTVRPDDDWEGEVSVTVAADAVTDLAGNGNAASEALARTCDVRRPTIAKLSRTDLGYLSTNRYRTVQVTMSEAVTNFTVGSLEIQNATVAVSGSGASYTVKIATVAAGAFSVRIPADAMDDLAGNGNVATAELTGVCDVEPPTKPVVTASTHGGTFTLTAASTDDNGVKGYLWFVNGVNDAGAQTANPYVRTIQSGETVRVYVQTFDAAGNFSVASDVWEWTYEAPPVADVEFGGGISIPVDPDTGATNEIKFVAVDFKAGADSVFTLSGFSAETEGDITGLTLDLVVSDRIDGQKTRESVKAEAKFEDGCLKVTLPAKATENKGSYFVFGVDNQVQ